MSQKSTAGSDGSGAAREAMVLTSGKEYDVEKGKGGKGAPAKGIFKRRKTTCSRRKTKEVFRADETGTVTPQKARVFMTKQSSNGREPLDGLVTSDQRKRRAVTKIKVRNFNEEATETRSEKI